MGAIDLQGSPITVSKIARLQGLNRQGVQRIVNDLEKLGFVTLNENPDHKRAKLVALSSKGKKAMVKVNNAQAVWVNKIADKLGDAKMKQVFSLMKVIKERSEKNRPS